jgi:hypothetical protein
MFQGEGNGSEVESRRYKQGQGQGQEQTTGPDQRSRAVRDSEAGLSPYPRQSDSF